MKLFYLAISSRTCIEFDDTEPPALPAGYTGPHTADEMQAWRAALPAIGAEPAVIEPVPETVPLWTIRAMLANIGLLDQVDAAVRGMAGPEGRVAQAQWEYGNFIDRAHPLIAQLGTGLGLDAAALDQLFIAAAKLT